MSDYKKTSAQQAQNNMIGEVFFRGENGQKMQVISPLNNEDGVMWFLTHDPQTGDKFRNEIKIKQIK